MGKLNMKIYFKKKKLIIVPILVLVSHSLFIDSFNKYTLSTCYVTQTALNIWKRRW